MTVPTKLKPGKVVKLGEPDELFMLEELIEPCMDAGNRASRRFDPHYPGWKLYCRIARGEYQFDRDLKAWAIRMARMYVRTRKVTGRPVVPLRGRRNNWISAAGMDALLFVIFGRWPESFEARAIENGVDDELYKRITVALGVCMLDGFENYRSELHYAMSRVKRDNAKIN